MIWFALAYLWPAPVEIWDVVVEPPNPALQEQLFKSARRRQSRLFVDPYWTHEA